MGETEEMSAENFYSCQNLVYLIVQTIKETEINANHPKVSISAESFYSTT